MPRVVFLCCDLLTRTLVVLLDHLDARQAGELSTLFDVGGIFGESFPPCCTWTETLPAVGERLGLCSL